MLHLKLRLVRVQKRLDSLEKKYEENTVKQVAINENLIELHTRSEARSLRAERHAESCDKKLEDIKKLLVSILNLVQSACDEKVRLMALPA